MSAWIVSKAHIDALVGAAVTYDRGSGLRYYSNEAGPDVTGMVHWDRSNANHLGRMLWGENLKSIVYRYPNDASGDRPGPNDFTDDDVDTYQFPRGADYREPIVVLKSIDCYEYQSCEHPEWRGSAAKQFCEALRRRLIGELPGYDDAPWGIA